MTEDVHCSSECRADLTALGRPRTHWGRNLPGAESELGRPSRKGRGGEKVKEVEGGKELGESPTGPHKGKAVSEIPGHQVAEGILRASMFNIEPRCF